MLRRQQQRLNKTQMHSGIITGEICLNWKRKNRLAPRYEMWLKA